ncbi:MAG: hypothetical protein SXA11_25420 [Cyanobacteriota bacterium]|nr:hypothetical protein [Cyanobacteriota bacterium]
MNRFSDYYELDLWFMNATSDPLPKMLGRYASLEIASPQRWTGLFDGSARKI